MNHSLSPQELANTISAIILNSNLTDEEHWFHMKELLLDALDRAAGTLFDPPELDQVQADIVTLHAVDLNSGQMIRRTLPLTLIENHNALRLIGETLDGHPSEIVFLSESASQKVVELTGHGQDKPRCK